MPVPGHLPSPFHSQILKNCDTVPRHRHLTTAPSPDHRHRTDIHSKNFKNPYSESRWPVIFFPIAVAYAKLGMLGAQEIA